MKITMGAYKAEIGVKKSEKPSNSDLVQRITGSFGKYQLWLCVIIFLAEFPVAFHQMAIIFLAPKVEYTCTDTGAETCPCAEPVYNTSIFTNTIIMEWDLICDRRWLYSFTQMLSQSGTLVGSIVFGMASDRFGRRLPLSIAVAVQIVSGVAAAYAPNFWTFTFFRFLVGTSVGGTMVTGFVIVMEFVGKEYRDTISAIYQMPFNLGHMLLPVFAFFLRDYQKFQLAITLPSVILLSYFFLVPDTPRWLIAMKKTDKAIKVLERVAKVNKRPTENIQQDVYVYQAGLEKTEQKKGNITDLFRTPNLRKNILAMSYNWLSCSYCFYGVSQYVGQLGGDAFINVISSASVCLLGSIISIPLLKFVGRKTVVIVFNLISACCLLLLSVAPDGVPSVVLASIGLVTSFVVLLVAYLYCTELFPTVVRSAALGFSSMSARIGSMVAPFIVDLRSTAPWLPPVAFAVVPLIAAFVTFLLPETRGGELMTTIEEAEQFGKKVKLQSDCTKI